MSRICTCRCHFDGNRARHITKCCEHTGEKYISAEGDFDYLRFEKVTGTCASCNHWAPHLDDASEAEAKDANLKRFAENCGYWLCNSENSRCPIVQAEK